MRKLQTIAVAAVMLFAMALVMARAEAPQTETADFYKSKCVACHGKKAEKKFDSSLADDQLVEAILKGKKAEKPPNMPAYGEKGVTAEQAKALVDYMKQLKSTP
jgi:mono/diheme cytochrome c family protein